MSFELILGPMFSAKTSNLVIKFSSKSHEKVGIFISHSMDDRYNNAKLVGTHSDIIKMSTSRANTAKEVYNLAKGADVIAIDELQFFPTDILDVIKKLMRDGKIIIACGLSSDYRGKGWPTITECQTYATKITYLTGQCVQCDANSTMTHKKHHNSKSNNFKKIIKSEIAAYEPLCVICYMSHYL